MNISNLLTKSVMGIAVAGVLISGAVSADAKVDAGLADYKRASGVSGNLSSVGSDTLANLMTLWAEEFKREYPNVNIQIQAAGSSTAPPPARCSKWHSRESSRGTVSPRR